MGAISRNAPVCARFGSGRTSQGLHSQRVKAARKYDGEGVGVNGWRKKIPPQNHRGS